MLHLASACVIDALVSGKLVADPLVRQDKNGKDYTSAKLAVPQEDGQSVYASLLVFDAAAATKLALLKKGDPIAVVGRVSVRAWTKKDTSEPKAGLQVIVDALLTPYQVQRRRKPAAEGAP